MPTKWLAIRFFKTYAMIRIIILVICSPDHLFLTAVPFPTYDDLETYPGQKDKEDSETNADRIPH